MKKLLLFSLLLVFQFGFSQETIKTMFYNLLNFPSTQPARVSNLSLIIDDIQPDLFLVCELENEQGGEFLFDEALATSAINYVAAPFVSNQSTSNELQQLAYYNSDKLILDNVTTLQSDVITTDLRDINRYSFILNTPDAGTNPVYLEVFVTHLKAGRDTAPDTTNQDRRLLEVNALTAYLNNNATTFSNRYILFAGDFNVYNSNEPAYQEILDTANNNSIDFIDPIDRPGFWSSNSSFQDIHTQSTLRSNGHLGGDGATGGLDDRFDFILVSENLVGNPELEYVNGSYEAYGNNGNCYNDNINDSNCTGVYSQTVRNWLFNFSDHLPVVLDLQTNLNLLNNPDAVFEEQLFLPEGNIVDNQFVIASKTSGFIENISIFNSLGQQMERLLMPPSSEIRFDTANWPKGIYFVSLTSAAGKTTLKFIKR